MSTSIAPVQGKEPTIISDTETLDYPARCFWLTDDVKITFICIDGTTETFEKAGFYPWGVKQILSTGTDATVDQIKLGR